MKQKNNKKNIQNSPTIANQPIQKKIGFFSAMFIVMGSCIGAGIFFKAQGVLRSSHGSLLFAILCWIVAAFAVISMALALVEIASARNDNLSIIGWCKVFNSRTIYKASKNFMFYIYLPLTYFFMPLYVIMSLQDGIAYLNNGINSFGTNGNDWIIWTIIALVINFFFIFVSGLSSKAGNIMNLGILSVKFIPLVIVAFIGFVYIALEGTSQINVGFNDPNYLVGPASSFSSLTPGLGLFMAIGGVFFAYDGFYFSAGIQSEMKEPKKTPMAIVFGLGATTIIYLFVAISMALNGNGSFYGFGEWLKNKNAGWLFGLVNICIAIGIMGILNAFAMWAPRFVENLIADNELPYSSKYKNKLNTDKPKIGIYYSIIISVPFIIIATLIGALAYSDTAGYGSSAYGEPQMAKLFSFADLVGTWTAVFAFAFVMLAIYGGLRNRKNKFVETHKQKWFVWSGCIAVVIISLALLFLIIEPFVDLFMLTQLQQQGVTYNGTQGNEIQKQIDDLQNSLLTSSLMPNQIVEINNKISDLQIKLHIFDINDFTTDEVLGRVMKFLMLILYLLILFGPTIIEDKIHIKKYGTLEKYQKAFNIETTEIARKKASLNVLHDN